MGSNLFMRLTAAAIFASACTYAHADTVDVFSACENGSAKFVRIEAQPGVGDLIRQGLAMWSSGVIDRETMDAMAEGRGFWALISEHILFQTLPTKTPVAYLAAVARTESGRAGRYWPWTINYRGKSYFYGSKALAVAAASELIENGETVFDVGLMQVNWRFNGYLFPGIEAAFDPETNILVADYIVQQHLRETGSLAEAIGRYHSKTPSRKGAYLMRVNSHLNRMREQPLTNLMRMQPCT